MTLKLPILAHLATWAITLSVLLIATPTGRADTTIKRGGVQRNEGSRENGQYGEDERNTPTPNTLLERAIRIQEARPALTAKIRQRVELFGHQLAGTGDYAEQRTGPGLEQTRFRLSMRIQLEEQTSTLLVVCDGRYLWTYRKRKEAESLKRINVARVQNALDEAGQTYRLETPESWPGLGGLPRLLRGLGQSFDYTIVGRTRLADQVPAWILRGQWKPEPLARLLPDEKENIGAGQGGDLSKLPDHAPDHVLVSLGTNDAFPYRVEYRRRVAQASNAPNPAADRPIVTIEFHEVNFDAPIDPARFSYHPGNLDYSDETTHLLEKLGLAGG